jgi:hypothetical protein
MSLEDDIMERIELHRRAEEAAFHALYRLIAGAIREVVENDRHPNPKTIAESIAMTLRARDPAFDAGRFMVETGTLAREWAT